MLHNNILQVRDESNLGSVYNEMQLSFASSKVTVEEIIRERVMQEVEKYNQKASSYEHALVKPESVELMLNNKPEKKHVDGEKQVQVALHAFANNGFFMLVDDMQAEDLQQVVEIKKETVVCFVKLTALVGG